MGRDDCQLQSTQSTLKSVSTTDWWEEAKDKDPLLSSTSSILRCNRTNGIAPSGLEATQAQETWIET